MISSLVAASAVALSVVCPSVPADIDNASPWATQASITTVAEVDLLALTVVAQRIADGGGLQVGSGDLPPVP